MKFKANNPSLIILLLIFILITIILTACGSSEKTPDFWIDNIEIQVNADLSSNIKIIGLETENSINAFKRQQQEALTALTPYPTPPIYLETFEQRAGAICGFEVRNYELSAQKQIELMNTVFSPVHGFVATTKLNDSAGLKDAAECLTLDPNTGSPLTVRSLEKADNILGTEYTIELEIPIYVLDKIRTIRVIMPGNIELQSPIFPQVPREIPNPLYTYLKNDIDQYIKNNIKISSRKIGTNTIQWDVIKPEIYIYPTPTYTNYTPRPKTPVATSTSSRTPNAPTQTAIAISRQMYPTYEPELRRDTKYYSVTFIARSRQSNGLGLAFPTLILICCLLIGNEIISKIRGRNQKTLTSSDLASTRNTQKQAGKITIALLNAMAGVAGNLIAAWIQQDVITNAFTPSRVAGTVIGITLMVILIGYIEGKIDAS